MIKIRPIVIVAVLLLFGCHQQQHPSLKFTHIYDPLAGENGRLNADWINARLAEHRLLQPDMPVELEQVKWDQIDTKSMADFRAGIPHDVIITSPQFLAKHAVVGDLLDLSPMLRWSEDNIGEFKWNPVWDACNQQDELIGLPMGAHTRLCAYRKDMFAEVGLDPEKPPQTLDELVEYARRLTRDIDGDGKIDVWGLGIYFGPSRATIEITFAPILWHFGGELWDEQSKQAVFASEQGIAAAQFLSDLINKHQVTPRWAVSGTIDDVVLRPFLAGLVAMAWGWGSYWIQPLEATGMVSHCFPPSAEAEMTTAGIFLTPTIGHAQFTNSWTISLHALSPHPEKSMEFLKLFVQPEALETFPDAGLPAQLSTWRDARYSSPFYQVWFEAIKSGRSMPATAHYEELSNTIAAALQEILIHNAPVAPTLLRFQRAYNSRYAGE
ncbi:MAG: extracellular solute-binding protein [Candidatus Zhuqueibacterota bacterium]